MIMSLPTINKITILGSGVMGHGIAQVSAMAGYNVTLRDIEQSFLDKAMEKIKWSLNKLVEKQRLSQTEADKIFARIVPIVDLKQALNDADILIEAVPEDMNLKKKVYADVDNFAETKTLYASNTSTLPITEIASLTSRPDRFIGLHFFNPPQLMPLVEVIPGSKTNNTVIDMAIGLVQKIGKQPVLCKKDVAGFIVNRIFIPLVHEAVYCQERDNASMTAIDSAVKFKLSFPMGIFERINLTEQEAEKYNPIALLGVAANNAAWLISNSVCSKEDLEKALKLGMGLKKQLFLTVQEFGVKNVVQNLQELAAKYGTFYEPDPYLINYRD